MEHPKTRATLLDRDVCHPLPYRGQTERNSQFGAGLRRDFGILSFSLTAGEKATLAGSR